MTNKPVWTLDQINQNFDRVHWAWSSTIDYTFYEALPTADSQYPEYQGFTAFTAEQRTAVQTQLALYADIANIHFNQVADNGQVPWSDGNHKITFANSSTMPAYAWGWAATGSDLPKINGRYQINGSEIWVNSAYGTGSYAPGTYNLTAITHEMGHALGLPHPGDYNAGSGGSIIYENQADYVQDSRMYSVMSYFDASQTGAKHYDSNGYLCFYAPSA
jgi:serralysin